MLALTGEAVTVSAGTVVPGISVDIGVTYDYLVDEYGNNIVDEDGNFIVVGVTAAAPVTVSAGTLGAASGTVVALSGSEVAVNAGSLSVSGGDAEVAEGETATGGWLWGLGYERYLDRQRKKRKREIELEEAEEQAQQLRATEREIATLLHEQERQDLERAESERLLRMARRYADSVEIADKLREAMAKAAALETFGALEALKRELERTAEEEEVALLLILNQ